MPRDAPSPAGVLSPVAGRLDFGCALPGWPATRNRPRSGRRARDQAGNSCRLAGSPRLRSVSRGAPARNVDGIRISSARINRIWINQAWINRTSIAAHFALVLACPAGGRGRLALRAGVFGRGHCHAIPAARHAETPGRYPLDPGGRPQVAGPRPPRRRLAGSSPDAGPALEPGCCRERDPLPAADGPRPGRHAGRRHPLADRHPAERAACLRSRSAGHDPSGDPARALPGTGRSRRASIENCGVV